jgi:hypothetical protein
VIVGLQFNSDILVSQNISLLLLQPDAFFRPDKLEGAILYLVYTYPRVPYFTEKIKTQEATKVFRPIHADWSVKIPRCSIGNLLLHP